MNFSFDVISDLNLTSNDEFVWEDRATSLYCVVPGNISNDLAVVKNTLGVLGNSYHGVFYIDGALEHSTVTNRVIVTKELTKIAKSLRNVVYLHDNVIVIGGVALIAANGWCDNYIALDHDDELELACAKNEDYIYISNTIKKLQIHIDIRKIIIVSNCVPSPLLYYGEYPAIHNSMILTDVLEGDTQHKISDWVFGTHDKIVDTTINSIHYLNNSCHKQIPYYPKRFEV